MKIGYIGAGKLGTPVALTTESRGHEVMVYDISPEVKKYFSGEKLYPHLEERVQDLLETTKIVVADSVEDVVSSNDIVFCAIQTPHEALYEGVTRLPNTRADFNYEYLKKAIRDISDTADKLDKQTTLVVISTCLPGTYEKEIKPLLSSRVNYAYNPLYIAMGTVLQDYLNPEFNLIGVESEEAADQLEEFYRTINDAPALRTDITTAEGIKVFYNTFITAKTLLANAWMQSAHKMNMNVDDITKAISMSTKRLLSRSYLRGGGPDSGGCHPRDLIALAKFGEDIDLTPNLFEIMAQARVDQTEWTTDLIAGAIETYNLPVVIMGKSFKPETNIQTGSGAILLKNILKERHIKAISYDPYDESDQPPTDRAIYFIATEHKEFKEWNYPSGSIVIDLWRSVDPPKDCLYIPIGNPNAIQDQRREI